MKVIDAHAHVFEHLHGFGWRGEFRATGDGAGIWSNGDRMRIIPPGYGGTSFLVEDLLRILAENKVEKAVLLQGSLYGFANDYAAECVRKYPGILKAAGTYDPYCVDSSKILHRLIDELKFDIIKLELSSFGGFMGYHPDFRIDGSQMDLLWNLAEERGLVIVLDIGSPGDASFQVTGIRDIARKFPHMPIVITHLGAPALNDSETFVQMLEVFSPCKNISFDISAMLWNVAPEPPPFPTAVRYLETAKKIVGAERLLWGSDVPCVLTKFTYAQLLDFVLDNDIFTLEERENILYNNADRIYF